MYDVIHLTVAHPWNDPRILLKECVSLAQSGLKVALVTTESPVSEFSGVDIFSLDEFRSRFKRAFILPARCLFFCLKTPSRFVHFHDPELLIAGVVLSILGRKVIYDSHENLSKWLQSRPYGNGLLRYIIPRAARAIEWTCSKFFYAFVAATPDILKQFPEKRTYLVRNFPLEREVHPNTSEMAIAQLPDGITTPFFIYAGIINSIRGVPKIVEAMKYLPPNVKLVIAGSFKEDGLESSLKGSPEWSRVIYLGHIDRNLLFQLMRRAVAGLVTFLPAPNHLHAYPTKLFEYWAAGIPVVASDFNLWKELVQTGGGLVTDPNDSKSIAFQMRRLIEDPELRKELSNKASRAVREHFTWNSQVKNLLLPYSASTEPIYKRS